VERGINRSGTILGGALLGRNARSCELRARPRAVRMFLARDWPYGGRTTAEWGHERPTPRVGTLQESDVMPHPTTMSFAWDKQVQRATRVLLVVLALTIAVLLGGTMLIDHETGTSPSVTAHRNAMAVDFASRSTVLDTED